jgi:type IV secretory pathway VirB10-like protein
MAMSSPRSAVDPAIVSIKTGQKVVQKDLNIQPTLTVRSGFPVRAILNREPYKGVGDAHGEA